MEGFPIFGDAHSAAIKTGVSRIIILEKEYKEIFKQKA